MFHVSKIHATGAGLWLAVAAACAVFGGPSAPIPALARAVAEPRAAAKPSVVASPAAHPGQPECRASNPTIDTEIQHLRQRCELELEAFAACRAARPAWGNVKLFSCGFEMSTSLAKGDVEDPASLEDCGTPAPIEPATLETAAPEEHRADCPVPACEAELEQLKALKIGRLSAAGPAC